MKLVTFTKMQTTAFAKPPSKSTASLLTQKLLSGTTEPPQGIHNLLGLGLKYCLETPRPWQDLRKSMYQFQCSVRLHFFFKNKAETDSDSECISSNPDRNVQYIPLLYIPSEWSPPIVNRDAKRALEKFETKVTNLQRKLPTTCRFNLLQPQNWPADPTSSST
jgi:hypothetical protein